MTPGFSWAKLLILTGWFFLLFYAGFYKAQYMPFLDPIRMGWLSIGILPWAYGFSSKNNIIGWLVGKSYEKVTLVFFLQLYCSFKYQLNYLHRFAGRIVVLAVNIHAIDYCEPSRFSSFPLHSPSQQSTSGNSLAHFTRKSLNRLTCGA